MVILSSGARQWLVVSVEQEITIVEIVQKLRSRALYTDGSAVCARKKDTTRRRARMREDVKFVIPTYIMHGPVLIARVRM